jgi:7-cyano-7-deazaguanine reductase
MKLIVISDIFTQFYVIFRKNTQIRKHKMSADTSQTLATFSNPNPENDYTIHIEIPEFTCLCPNTGQPDFATLLMDYVPDQLCIELKSLKLYVWSYRDEGVFHEAVTNRILNDLVKTSKPRFMRLTSKFNVRGGIYTSVVVEHFKQNWVPPVAVNLP